MSADLRPKIYAGGEIRYLTTTPRRYPVGANCTGIMGVGTAPTILEDAQLPPTLDLSDGVLRIMDQDGHNLCWAFGWTGALQTACKLAGHVDVNLSPGFLAGTTNGGQDEGAAVDEPVPFLLKVGVAPNSLVGDCEFHPSRWPVQAKVEAAKHKVAAVWDMGHSRILQALRSGVARGWPCPLGTSAWGGGHLVFCTGYSIPDNTYWGPNSWAMTDDWEYAHPTRKGFWLMPAARLNRSLEMFGAFALQAAAPNPDDLGV
jgi:hypothetical protein